MIFILAILVLFQRYSIDAAPLFKQALSNDLPSGFAVFERATNADACNGRTIWDIIWSCLATTFACTWVSVHPNIPFLRNNKWAITKWRLYLMFLTLLAPEVLLMWAFKQCQGALMIRETVNSARPEYVQAKWTMTHAHYLQMGGFRVHCTAEERKGIPYKFGYRMRHADGVYEITMSFEAFKKLLSHDLIDFPSITEEEIEDKSGRDALSKAIAMLQLVWFIIQIAARAHQKLAITELELTTAALASLNIAMYLSWWDKPIDVLCPTIITTKAAEKQHRLRKLHLRDSGLPQSCPTPTSINEDASADRWIFPDNVTTGLAGYCWHKFLQSLGAFASNIATSVKQSLRSVRTLPQRLSKLYTKLKNWRGDEASCARTRNGRNWSSNVFRTIVAVIVLCGTVPWETILHFFLALILYPVQAILASGYFPGWRTNLEATEIDTKSTFDVVFSRRHLRLMMEMVFSSEEVENSPFFCFSAIAGAVFGAIHCAAWNFDFPSRVEQRFWRVSSLCVLGICFLLLVCGVAYSMSKPKRKSGEGQSIFAYYFLPRDRSGFWMSTTWMSTIGAIPAIFYIVSRICLLVLSITTLRALPPSAFEIVQWSEFIPHI